MYSYFVVAKFWLREPRGVLAPLFHSRIVQARLSQGIRGDITLCKWRFILMLLTSEKLTQ